MPRADNLPSFDFETRNVPSTTNPMGLKGAGEAGTIASTPAVMNAVQDALWRGYGDRAHRHAGDAVRRLRRDPQGGGEAGGGIGRRSQRGAAQYCRAHLSSRLLTGRRASTVL